MRHNSLMDPALCAPAVATAADTLGETIRRTPLEMSLRLSGELHTPVLLKREDLQVGRSYKVRGAYTLISSLPESERAHGIVCASAGNHAQGVAFACRQLRIRGRVFLPTTTPRQKRDRIQAIGGPWIEQVITGLTFDACAQAAQEEAEQSGATYVPPFDDPRIIAGQGTVGKEILEQASSPVGTIIVPVGGGGLISGIALWVKAQDPSIRIIGVEPAGAASMQAALRRGEPTPLEHVDPFVDGAAVGKVGTHPLSVVRELVDDIVSVPAGAVCTEMLDLYQTEGVIAEPAGAMASAAARRYVAGLGEASSTSTSVVCVISGGNNDVSRYADVLERSLVHEGLRHYFLVTFPQQPGALRSFLNDTLGPDDDIVLFEYTKKNNRETGPALVGIDVATPEALPALVERMAASPLSIEKLAPDSPVFGFLL
ncbi:MAG: threonine ammonia-lyase IlvA [Bowdeniella nasicola]|nr:threonine ammonia-lyase IlvA [Bowdeniella nasicola]